MSAMSFYIVPAMSYQQKQKLKQNTKKGTKSSSSSKAPSAGASDSSSQRSGSLLGQRSLHSANSDKTPPSSEHTYPPGTSHRHSMGSQESRRQSEATSQKSPSFSSRTASWVSELSRRSSNPAQVSGFTPIKTPETAVSEEKEPEEKHDTVPEYVPFTDTSIFNSEEGLRKTFINPAFSIQRFQGFLDVISQQHVNDPITFATVRDQSLSKFLSRRSVGLSKNTSKMSVADRSDPQRIGELLSQELLKCRSIMRTLLKLQLKNKSCYRKLACEQLIQGNFVNYVRFILMLPECTEAQAQTLTEFQKKDYEIKHAFADMAEALYALKKDNYEDDISTRASLLELLLSSITKTSFDFILLEKYTIQILMKLNNDYLIESRITRHLFNLYYLNVQLRKEESLKVLVFNSSFSSAYSWYLSVTLPFVRVFEASLLNENVSLSSEGPGISCPSSSDQTDFTEADHDLFNTYFSQLNIPDFATFSNLSRKELVAMQRAHATKVQPGKTLVKPINFEYYAHSMTTIQSETFHVIQCRDFRAQIKPDNHVKMLQEFYRLLRVGGVLELPWIIAGDGTLGSLRTGNEAESRADSEQRNTWSSEYTFESVREILTSLGELFGAPNVKFSSVLLTSKNEMNSFLIKHNAMAKHESSSEIDSFQAFAEAARNLGKTDENDFHFYFYIRAEKA